MTREEAINKVRQMSLPKETMDILEALAPELAMSEDERMINELQGFLSSFGSDYFGTGEWQKFDNWLEKQKEQKPAEWSEEDVYIATILEHLVGKNRPNEIFKIGNKQGVSAYKLCSWLKHLPERINLKPKQKWSEEDEDMLNCCISSIEEAKENRYAYKETDGDTSYDREIDWLKSLRSQPRAKTNDYITPHKKFFKWIYNRLIDVHGENPNVDYMQSFKKRIDNLQFDEPRWKPSEEQIGALNYAYCELFKRKDVGHNILGPLQELLDNLKKLM